MTECGLVGIHPRPKWRRAKANTAPAPDLLQGDFTAEASDHKWVPDITEFACWDGKLLLAGIKDLHDQSIVGWSMGIRQTTDLVLNALVMALSRRHPDNNELTHHPDRASQYTSLEFSTRLADWCIDPSYSRSGTCFDNAAMESTWATSKTEIHHIYGSWSEMTRSQLRTALFSYIETFHNRSPPRAPNTRRHLPCLTRSLKYQKPVPNKTGQLHQAYLSSLRFLQRAASPELLAMTAAGLQAQLIS